MDFTAVAVRLACLVAVISPLLLAGHATPVRAGAWTQQPGAGQVITSFGRRADTMSGFFGGEVVDDSNFSALYFEYGVIEGLTVGGGSFVEITTAEIGDNTADIGLFVRKRIWQGQDGDVASVQFGFRHPVDDLLGDSFGGDGADPTQEVSLRAQYGRGFGFDWGNAFISTEIGYHLQTDGDDDEIRADITVGAQPWDCCMLLLSAFSTFVPGSSGEDAIKIAPSVTYRLELGAPSGDADGDPVDVTFQFGISQDILNFDEGLGFQISVWESF